MSDMVRIRELRLVERELRAEIERLKADNEWFRKELRNLAVTDKGRMREQLTEAAAFLDAQAKSKQTMLNLLADEAAACRAQAKKLREWE